jgi:hypothetical protein
MGETRNFSWHEHGQTGATNKPDTPRPVRGNIDFLLAISIGSVAFGILLLLLILVYLLNGMSAEALAIWICCAIVAPGLMILGGGLLLFTKRIPRDRPGKPVVG